MTAKVLSLDADKMLTDVLNDTTLQAQIVDLNQSQLYDKGVQTDGSPTGSYHPITIAYKIAHGDARGVPGRTDHITGLDTGRTYDSMQVVNIPAGFTVEAEDRNHFFDREPKGLGLTEESIAEIIPAIRDGLLERTRNEIFA